VYLGDDVNVQAIVSSLQEKTRLKSKSKRLLPTRMLRKTNQIKHVCYIFHFTIKAHTRFRKLIGAISMSLYIYLVPILQMTIIQYSCFTDPLAI
jgi:hypothetical protein